MHDRLALPPTFPSASPRMRRRVRLAGVAQLVEHLLCKQVVGGSSPPASSTRLRPSEGCPSGQREQAVNLPAHAYVGSNPTPSTCQVGNFLRAGADLHAQGSGFFVFRQASTASRPTRVLARPGRFVLGVGASSADRDLVFQDSRLDPGAAWAAPRVVGTHRATRLAAGPAKGASGSSSFNFAGVAQLVERQPSKLNVEGSSPFSRSGNKADRSDVEVLSRQRAWAARPASLWAGAAEARTRAERTYVREHRTGAEAQPARKIAGRPHGRNDVSAHLAQLVEHVLGKDEVTSSTLVVGSGRLGGRLYAGNGLDNSKGVGK